MFLARLENQVWAKLGPEPPTIDQVLPTPGGRDSGRLGSSVRTWLAEAATAADLKGGLLGEALPGKSLIFSVIVQKVPG